MTEHRACLVCGAAIAPDAHHHVVTCGKECHRQRRRALKHEYEARRQRLPPAKRERRHQSLLGQHMENGRGGGLLPAFRPAYPASVRAALHKLAESNPTPEHYERERARILGGTSG